MEIFGSFNPNLTRQYDYIKKTNPEVYKLFEELDLFNVIGRIEMSDKAVKVFMDQWILLIMNLKYWLNQDLNCKFIQVRLAI